MTILGIVWLAPIALPVWAFFVLPAWGLRLISRSETRRGVVLFHVILRWKWWERLWRRGDVTWLGLTLPFCILLNVKHLAPQARQEVISHELRHQRQWQWLGPLFPLVYGVLLLWFGYSNNPLERDARAHEGA